MAGRHVRVYAKANNPFHFSNKQNRPIFQSVGSRKHIHVEAVEQAFTVSQKMDVKSTIQYFNMLGIDYLRACKYHKTVHQLENMYRIRIEEPK
jgi:hypothetical protein